MCFRRGCAAVDVFPFYSPSQGKIVWDVICIPRYAFAQLELGGVRLPFIWGRVSGMRKNDDFFNELREQSLIKAKIVRDYFWAWSKVIIATQKKYVGDQKIAYIDFVFRARPR